MNNNILENFDTNYITDLKLWDHQKKLLKYCINEEKKYNYLSLSEKPGSGKTHIMLSLIQYYLLQNIDEKTLLIVNNNIYQQWVDSIFKYPHMKYLNFCDYSNISSLMFDNDIMKKNENIFISTPVYYSMLRDVLQQQSSCQFKRIIIDEIDNLTFFINNNFFRQRSLINTDKLWFVSGTFDTKMYNDLHIKEFKNISLNDYDLDIIPEKETLHICNNYSVELFKNIIPDDELTLLNGLDYDAFANKLGLNKKITKAKELIKEYKNKLNKEIENINQDINSYYEMYNDLNNRINKGNNIAANNDDENEMKKILDEINSLKQLYEIKNNQIHKIVERIKEDKICMICYENINISSFVSNLCCNSIYCKSCITKWADINDTCPNCRGIMDYSIFENYDSDDSDKYKSTYEKYINNGNNHHKVYCNFSIDSDDDGYNTFDKDKLENKINSLKNETFSVKNNYDDKINMLENEIDNEINNAKENWEIYNTIIKYPDKIEILKTIIQDNLSKKIIIFNEYSNVFNKVTQELDKMNIHNYLIFDIGNLKSANDSINKFKNGDINILFLDGLYNSHGINFENCDVLILMHKMKKDKEQQMISRAQRPGRTSQLEIHKLFYKNESEYKEMPKELTINNIVLNTNNIILE